MARALPIERLGGWYHVSAVGNERKDTCRSDHDRRYRDYREKAVREGLEKSPWESVQQQAVEEVAATVAR